MMMQQELLLADEGKRESLFEFSTGILSVTVTFRKVHKICPSNTYLF